MVFLTLLAVWLRLAHLGQPSLWWDEFITIGASMRPLADMLRTLRNLGPSDISVELFPPLYHVLVHTLLPVGNSDVLMRLPGALFGAATIPAVYFLSRNSLGRLTALCAALLTALSVFHLHYSREVRPYPLFMFENVLALWAVYEGLVRNRRKLLWLYGALVCAMFYTSYMAATLVAGQLAWAGLVLAWGWAHRPQARRRVLADAAALSAGVGLAMLCYLPWVPGQLNVLKLLRDPGTTPGFTFDFVSQSLKEFAAFAYQGDFPAGEVLGLLGLLGLVVAVAQGRGGLVLLLCLWALTPIAGIFAAKARMELTARYVFPVFFALIIFAAHFLASATSWLADRLFSGSPAIFTARLVVAVAACLLLSRPNMESLSGYYTREISFYKQAMLWLAENRDNKDFIIFYHPRNAKLVYNWYAGGLFADVRTLSDSGYHRAYLMAQAGTDVARHAPAAILRATVRDDCFWELGLLRRGQVPMIADAQGRFVYADDFSTLKMLEDVAYSENLAPSLSRKTLTPYDSGLPGQARYHFMLPEGGRVSGLTLSVRCSAQFLADLPTDARVEAALEGVPGGAVVNLRVDMADFRTPQGGLVPANHEGKRFATCTVTLEDQNLQPGQELSLVFTFSSAGSGAAIEVENFRLEARLDGPQATPEKGLLAAYAHLAKSTAIAPWRPGVELVDSKALHAFSARSGLSAAGLGGPAELEAYRKAHPGQEPVYVLNASDGQAGIVLYDPALHRPALALEAGKAKKIAVWPQEPRTFASVRLRGALNRPTIALDGKPVTLPVICPAPAELAVNFGQGARLYFSPLFTQDQLDLGAAVQRDNIAKNQDEDCLSCVENRPCSITYAVHSEMGIGAFRVRAYPRVFCDSGMQNAVNTFYSLDGVHFLPLNSFASTGSGRWEGLKEAQISYRMLERPAGKLFVRFELSGPKAQLWSARDARMRISAALDAQGLAVPSAGAWPATFEADQPLEALLMGETLPFIDRLRRAH